jgi:hypothetical protein
MLSILASFVPRGSRCVVWAGGRTEQAGRPRLAAGCSRLVDGSRAVILCLPVGHISDRAGKKNSLEGYRKSADACTRRRTRYLMYPGQ